MFQDLDDTLTKMLNDQAMKQLTPPLTELFDAEVSFITPDKNFIPGQITLNLFLYDVKENRELRDPVPIMEKVNNTFVQRQPPLRMDCSYIITAWSSSTGQVKVAEEHRLLSQAVLWLSRFPTIPNDYLQGDLVEQPFLLPTWIAQMDPNKNAGEFWNALGIAPRSAFYLTVTIAMNASTQTPLGVPVISKEVTVQLMDNPAIQEHEFQIGGKIFAVLNPDNLIEGAQVFLLERNQSVTTDAQGQFTFNGLSAGHYTLRISKNGFSDQTKNIVVPATVLNAYDVGMAP